MDKQTLDDYENNRQVEWKDIKRRLLLNERLVNPHIPDHFLRATIDNYLPNESVCCLSDLLTLGLYSLVEKYIIPQNGKLYISKDVFSKWQELLTFCPPLLLIASYLYYTDKDVADITNYIETYISKNTRYTAILPPYIDNFETFIGDNKGVNDLHIHLNGSTETDVIWQDALNYPNKIRKKYRAVFGNDLVIEQNEQECIFKDPNQLYELLERARALRLYLITAINRSNLPYPNTDAVVFDYTKNLIRDEHPLKTRYALKDVTELECECLMYINLFQTLEQNSNDKKTEIAKAFHHYLLILGSINRFVVQQIHQNGFQQFQKITLNDIRSFSEEKYGKRFSQLSGNNNSMSNFNTLEGRFAPKMTPKEIDSHINKIRLGWYGFKNDNNSAELNLVSHFIKKRSSYQEKYRHEELRNNLWIQANAILSLMQDEEWMKYPKSDIEKKSFHKLVGIDAAASEFDAPPEVFAPTYRLLRNNGVRNFTYHVGEDFSHIISGLRAIYETIEFLEFESGNRIGHATALGVSPQLWKERIGEKIYIRRGEWVDNLIFVYELLKSNCCYTIKINDIKNAIQNEICNIYGDSFEYSMDEIIAAWKSRKWDPELVLCESYTDAQVQNFNELEWKSIQNSKFSTKVKEIIRKYHDPSFRKNYDVMILVDFKLIDVPLIKRIQSKIARILKKKNIIIETLPTSNVRIGIYKSHIEHHIKDWMKVRFFKNNLKIVVGSDDAGVFASNIYNEYANIYCNLTYNDRMRHNEAMKVIENLNKNGRIYKFT
ncbi:hypothetical protein LJC68_03365 [Bacteroidales bacterium OttesenSCG-928-B11]|nr:hypothetical protein [Bacteroidales bacterium OttesenSCG-928-E04]MDL2311899.1 hypothetical protein [Bacteroidales bacterium OttesenSCG-928-B11]